MDSSRTRAIATGVLLITATASAVTASAVAPSLTGRGYLTGVGDHPDQLSLAACLYLLAAGTSAAIAVALYPVLRRRHPAAALGAVVFRTIEAVMYSIGVISLLSILPLARTQDAAPASIAAMIQVTADSLLSVRDSASVVGVFAFCVGSLLYSLALFETRVIPRWLAGWGVVASLAMFTACMLSVFSGQPITGYVALIIPIFGQELVLAAWLLLKGFAPDHQAPLASVAARAAA
ncbi:MAG: DUF4386 domain-containing protein [Propionicimonas sp.]